ncbi:MAG TPA: beta-ketoacyl-[acyl-carrier-protein] synthase family protein [Myxococcota bacterium]|nr:beta-ketoacyl-[acyl-carrier-protein] synthase family protein [Myxococcota bacterium]HQK52577.1 beta-ketoacyl-[acyl-carrier-protein] synthase family protein [Myxococcota bacterium]
MEPVVAVTGLGCMTGLGLDLEATWRGILDRRRVIRRYTHFDPAGLEVPVGVELPEGADEVFRERIKPRTRSQMTRATQMAVACAEAAMEDAGFSSDGMDPTRVGVVVGATGTGYAPTGDQEDPNRILRNMTSASAAWISLRGHWTGPSMVVSTACSSGTYALAAAWDWIVRGDCDVVLAGAAESALNPLDIRGFTALMALAEPDDDVAGLSRPFDARRKGFVMGEGAGFLVLESLAHAQRRGARILAVMYRPGLSSEAYNILSPEPGGVGMARTMELALARAGLSPEDIDHVNAHGTSTPLNDLYETQAIHRVFGAHARRMPVSSTKGATGHCLSGAAGVEAVLTVRALVEGVIPPTLNLTTPDPECDLDYVADGPRRAPLRHVASNSFAFGGQNGVVIFRRWEGQG